MTSNLLATQLQFQQKEERGKCGLQKEKLWRSRAPRSFGIDTLTVIYLSSSRCFEDEEAVKSYVLH